MDLTGATGAPNISFACPVPGGWVAPHTTQEGPLGVSVLGGESLGCNVDRGIMKGDSMKGVLICDHKSGSFQPLLRVTQETQVL